MARNRTTYNHREVCHRWAHGLDDFPIRGSRIFTDWASGYPKGGRPEHARPESIFSYGRHFEIARRLAQPGHPLTVVYLINPDGYSSSTAKHQAYVRSAISWDDGVRVYAHTSLWGVLSQAFTRKPDAGGRACVLSHFADRIKHHAERLAANPRKHVTIGRDIARVLDQFDKIAETFPRLSLTRAALKLPENLTPESLKDYAAKAAKAKDAADKREAKKKAAEAARLAKANAEALPRWREGGMERLYTTNKGQGTLHFDLGRIGYAVLRLDPKDPRWVETSQGARVPVKVARRLFDALPHYAATREANGTRESTTEVPGTLGGYGPIVIEWGHGPNTVGDYPARVDTLRIGCHDIPLSEVEAFARHVGWYPPKGVPFAGDDAPAGVRMGEGSSPATVPTPAAV